MGSKHHQPPRLNICCLYLIINIQYLYIVGKYKIYLHELYKQVVSQRVQINFIFSDNIRILCLSCNIKRSKTTAKLSEKSRNNCRSKRCQRHYICDIGAYAVAVSFCCSTGIRYQKSYIFVSDHI